MNITPELIKAILAIVIVIAIVIFIVKRCIRLAICLGIIFLLFNIIFRYDGNDIRQKFKIDEYMKPETASKVTDFFNDFSNKRDQYAVIDEDKVYDEMKNGASTGEKIVIKGMENFDIDKFAHNLADKIYDAGIKEIDFNQLVSDIQKNLNVSQDDAVKIANEVMKDYNEKSTKG